MRGIVLILSLLASEIAIAQTEIPFVFNFGYLGQEDCVFFTEIGSEYFFVGTTSSTQEGLSDVFIMKTDTLLNTVFTKVIGNATVDQAVGGVSDGQTIYLLHNRLDLETGYDPMVSAYNSEGDLLWTVNVGSSQWEFGVKIKLIDNLLVIGGKNPEGVFVARITTEGEVFDIHDWDAPEFVLKDVSIINETVYLVGENLNPSGTNSCPSLFVALLPSDSFQEVFNAGKSGAFTWLGIRENEVVAAGRLWDADFGAEVFFVANFGLGGNVTNQAKFLAEGEIVDGLIKDDRYVFAAYNSTFALAQNDIYVFQTNFELQYAGAFYFDGPKNDVSTGIFLNLNGNYVITGKSNSHLGPDYNGHVIFVGDIPLGQSAAQNPPNIVFINSVLSIHESFFVKSGPILYPNPSSDYVRSSVPFSKLAVMNLSGTIVKSLSEGHTEFVDVRDLPPGAYTLFITTIYGQESITRLIVMP